MGILGVPVFSSHIRNFHSPFSSSAYCLSDRREAVCPGRMTPSSPFFNSTRYGESVNLRVYLIEVGNLPLMMKLGQAAHG